MRNDRRIYVAPWRLERFFPAFYQTVPHAEENLFLLQTQCYAFCKRIETEFSLKEKSVTVSFCSAQTPQLFKLLERVVPMTERISLEEEHVILYVKYFADPSAKERAIKILFREDMQ